MSRKASRRTRQLLFGAAVLCLLALSAGVVADIRALDRTRGGYEPPYTAWSGTPVDWSKVATTEEGMRKQGYVLDVDVDCTSGFIHFHVLGIRIPFRTLSPRALAIHKPREACIERGFAPAFG